LDASQPSSVLVGQSPACDFRLDDREVSRRHATLELIGRRLRVVDVGSTNGTFVNGVSVGEAHLRGGETIRVGGTTLTVKAKLGRTAALPEKDGFGRLHGESALMRRLYPMLERLAASNVAVLIEGETGTGKEVLAEAIHEQGPRASGPFVVFDCTATPPNLVESELFGHERGAFTGAVATRKGVFEQAHGGTLLIDEIGDLDVALQPKLLRVLERAEVRRVGGNTAIPVDVRILSATRRDLDREVQAERFRDDLYHRLVVARVELPPLRRREGDITLLAQRFATQLGNAQPLTGPLAGRSLSESLLARWNAYSWPGNVRELRNAVARHMALGELAVEPAAAAPKTSPTHGDFIADVLALGLPLIPSRQRVVEELERRYIEKVLAEHGGNVLEAAAASGLARRHFHRLKARARGG
jgi:DNA-binding NtrC family response regulator